MELAQRILNKKTVSVLGINSRFGKAIALLLKQSNAIKTLSLYDDNCIGTACDVAIINTPCKVRAFIGKDQLSCAIKNADVVIIADPCNYLCDAPEMILEESAPRILELGKVIAESCSNAIILVAANPINSTLPLLSQVLTFYNAYDCNKVLGVTSVDNIRANSILSRHIKHDPTKVVLPVVGGNSPDTKVPIFSQARPRIKLSKKMIKRIAKEIKSADTNVYLAKKELEALNKAYATNRFVHSVLAALRGEQNIAEIALSRTLFIPGASYFALPIILGRNGIQYRFPLPELTDNEEKLVSHAVVELYRDMKKGERYFTCTNIKEADNVVETKEKGIIIDQLFKNFRANISGLTKGKLEYTLLENKPCIQLPPTQTPANRPVPAPPHEPFDHCYEGCNPVDLPELPTDRRRAPPEANPDYIPCAELIEEPTAGVKKSCRKIGNCQFTPCDRDQPGNSSACSPPPDCCCTSPPTSFHTDRQDGCTTKTSTGNQTDNTQNVYNLVSNGENAQLLQLTQHTKIETPHKLDDSTVSHDTKPTPKSSAEPKTSSLVCTKSKSTLQTEPKVIFDSQKYVSQYNKGVKTASIKEATNDLKQSHKNNKIFYKVDEIFEKTISKESNVFDPLFTQPVQKPENRVSNDFGALTVIESLPSVQSNKINSNKSADILLTAGLTSDKTKDDKMNFKEKSSFLSVFKLKANPNLKKELKPKVTKQNDSLINFKKIYGLLFNKKVASDEQCKKKDIVGTTEDLQSEKVSAVSPKLDEECSSTSGKILPKDNQLGNSKHVNETDGSVFHEAPSEIPRSNITLQQYAPKCPRRYLFGEYIYHDKTRDGTVAFDNVKEIASVKKKHTPPDVGGSTSNRNVAFQKVNDAKVEKKNITNNEFQTNIELPNREINIPSDKVTNIEFINDTTNESNISNKTVKPKHKPETSVQDSVNYQKKFSAIPLTSPNVGDLKHSVPRSDERVNFTKSHLRASSLRKDYARDM